MSDVLSAVFAGELAFVYPSEVPSRTGEDVSELTFQAFWNNYWGVVYTHHEICSTEPNPSNCSLTLDEIMDGYLYQVESWYSKANLGQPKDSDIDILVSAQWRGLALRVLAEPGFGQDPIQPWNWGNYGFDNPNYATARYDESRAPYCHLERSFVDGGDLATAIHPPDTWNDAVFVLIVQDVGEPDWYRYGQTPPWVNEEIIVNGRTAFRRNHLPAQPESCD
jgi:hypothetical protein